MHVLSIIDNDYVTTSPSGVKGFHEGMITPFM